MVDIKPALLTQDLDHLVHPLHSRKTHRGGHVWVRGHGALMYDADGRAYLDGLSGLWNVVAGHGRTELAEAAQHQMSELAYCSGYAGSSNQRAIELATRLSELTYPSISRFFFTSGGGREASETSFKLARSYWKIKGYPHKTKVISRQWGYHGVTLAAMSATGISGVLAAVRAARAWLCAYPVAIPVSLRGARGLQPRRRGRRRTGTGDPARRTRHRRNVLGRARARSRGVIVPQDDYFPRIRQICDKHDVLFVADEVITGFGRTGKWFALEHWGVQPDIMQFAKAITSGYFPFGGVGCSEEIAAVLDESETPWMHAYTYSAHPVGCAVALRNLDILEREGLPSQAAEKGTYLLTRLRAGLGNHPHVGEIRGVGLMCAVEFVKDRATKAEFDLAERVGERLNAEVQKRGLFSRLRGDVFCLAPPFVTTQDELDRMASILADSVAAVLG